MFNNNIKTRIRRGEPVIGSWIALSDPYAVEAMANAGFDWLVIDTEHCPIGIEALRNILIATKGTLAAPVVRLMNNNPDYFKMALDLGAAGVIVPMVETVQDAQRALEASRYPPLGRRGCGPVRASDYFRQYDQYMERANDDILVAVQIETVQTLPVLDDILQVNGVDAIFVGPSDLGLSLTSLKDPRPTVESLMAEIFEKARHAGVPYGTLSATPEEFVNHVNAGATLLTIGGDLGFVLDGAAAAFSNTRALLKSRAVR